MRTVHKCSVHMCCSDEKWRNGWLGAVRVARDIRRVCSGGCRDPEGDLQRNRDAPERPDHQRIHP